MSNIFVTLIRAFWEALPFKINFSRYVTVIWTAGTAPTRLNVPPSRELVTSKPLRRSVSLSCKICRHAQVLFEEIIIHIFEVYFVSLPV